MSCSYNKIYIFEFWLKIKNLLKSKFCMSIESWYNKFKIVLVLYFYTSTIIFHVFFLIVILVVNNIFTENFNLYILYIFIIL